ncbi:MAG: response regulator transcription factor [Ruminococcus albus]|jgi:DNA-binding LytR/AlgR family response regulator|nr:response regulator transcription factor [Ruminococcus albus]
MIRIAICDDNNVFVNYMAQAVKAEFERQNNENIELETYISGELMFQHHLIKPFDVIFLDIDMPEPDGFQLAADISKSTDCYIIFVTNHPELVYDSLYFRPLNFIPKSKDSFFTEKLHRVINQLFNEMKQNTTIILENKEVGRVPLLIKNIYYIESSKHYVLYHSDNREPIKIRSNISELEKNFSQYDFVRIHKSYLVNLRHIFNINKNNDEIIFKQGFRLNMSKRYKQTVDEKLTQYLRKTK